MRLPVSGRETKKDILNLDFSKAMRRIMTSIICAVILLSVFASFTAHPTPKSRALQIMSKMTLEEKIAQLIMNKR